MVLGDTEYSTASFETASPFNLKSKMYSDGGDEGDRYRRGL